VAPLALQRLGKAEAAAMAAQVTDGALSDEMLDQIVAKTDGVPLFVEELTKTIQESGAESANAIPETLQDSLMERLDRLAPVKEVAQIGACIGREFSHELLAAVSPLGDNELGEALQQLVTSELIHRTSSGYVFKHALVQDAAYRSFLKTRRQHLHERIAVVLEGESYRTLEEQPEVLARHFTLAGLGLRAIPYWLRAGERAIGAVALSEAVIHLESGLRLVRQLEPGADRDEFELKFLSALGTAYLALKGWAATEIIDTFVPAYRLAKTLSNETQAMTALFYIWSHYVCRSLFDRSAQWLTTTLDLGEGDASADITIVGHWMGCIQHVWTGEFLKSKFHFDSVLRKYNKDKHSHIAISMNNDPKSVSYNFGTQALWILGFPDQARKAAMDSFDHAKDLGYPFNLAFNLTVGVGVFALLRQEDPARAWLKEAYALSREFGFPVLEHVLWPYWHSAFSVAVGDYKEGVELGLQGIEGWKATGATAVTPLIRAYIAHGLCQLDDHDRAITMIDHALSQIEQTKEGLAEAEANRVRGDILLGIPGNKEKAEKCFKRAIAVAGAQSAKSWELRAATSLARLWQSQGKAREAHDLLAPVYG
jgi:tetratricopeptide (TPR) repeat protein